MASPYSNRQVGYNINIQDIEGEGRICGVLSISVLLRKAKSLQEVTC